MKNNEVINWLLDGDVVIQYQVYRDLLDEDRKDLREKISKEGWGRKYLLLRNKDGHWGRGFYSPKWTSSHYTLIDLKNLGISPDIREAKETIELIIQNNKITDGGIHPEIKSNHSDVCVNGMFLNYACYFGTEEEKLESVVDFILSQQMKDGGFNCRSNKGGAEHSSLHTTLSVLEGILEFRINGYKYRISELRKAEFESKEFILRHKLYRSHRTGNIIKSDFLKFPYPPRWYYDIMKSMDYFQTSKSGYDERMQDAIDEIIKKRRKDNTWSLQASHPGKVHFEIEKGGMPSRWNTLRAMRILKYYKINY